MTKLHDSRIARVYPSLAIASFVCAIATGLIAIAVGFALAADAAGASNTGKDAPGDLPAYAAAYAQVLEQHTQRVPPEIRKGVGTTVDYRALLRPAEAETWRRVVADLAAAEPPTQRDAKLALWINAYNILAIDTVLRHYPIESIRDVGGFFQPVWDLDAGSVAGRAVTLHTIEHEILRPMHDPRIHAAIVCASTSCPSLSRTPYTAENVQRELDRAMERWLSNAQKGLRIDRANDRIYVSKIFDWFEDDWDAIGGVRAAVLRYAPATHRAWLEAHVKEADLEHFDYDWTLNDGARVQR